MFPIYHPKPLLTYYWPSNQTIRKHLIQDHGIDSRCILKKKEKELIFIHDMIHYAFEHRDKK